MGECLMIHLVIVNINGLAYTKSIVGDLLAQTCPFLATIYDQNSCEHGTQEYLASLDNRVRHGKVNDPRLEVIQNTIHVDLNRIWNQHYYNSSSPYLCFLNNDVRITNNFIADTLAVFDAEPTVGCVIHTTNHPDYRASGPLDYKILEQQSIQGWDFTFRTEAYTEIPDDLKTFGGDDYLFANLYANGWKTAVVLSSPVIHYYAKSRKYYTGSRQTEAEALLAYGYPKLHLCPYSRRYPPTN